MAYLSTDMTRNDPVFGSSFTGRPANRKTFPDSEQNAGTVYQVAEVITYESKNIKRLKKTYPLISVATRNFDISADALRAKLGVKEGGDLRLLAISDDHHSKFMLILRHV